jgi:tRNA (adenine57-N1/adenine58-N1)-methyltransferase
MVGHTGFLISARRLADGVSAPRRVRRPARTSRVGDQAWEDAEFSPSDIGEREVTAKKARRARRDQGSV